MAINGMHMWQYVANPDGNYVDPNNLYCNICNPFQYLTSPETPAFKLPELR
jgi:hypothetical protein